MTKEEFVSDLASRQLVANTSLGIHPDTAKVTFDVLSQIGALTSNMLEDMLISGALPKDIVIKATVEAV